jgi:hypothetical protein
MSSARATRRYRLAALSGASGMNASPLPDSPFELTTSAPCRSTIDGGR